MLKLTQRQELGFQPEQPDSGACVHTTGLSRLPTSTGGHRGARWTGPTLAPGIRQRWEHLNRRHQLTLQTWAFLLEGRFSSRPLDGETTQVA